ncbi:hypothetical protein [Pandoraea sp. NPDC090278]|uniref:hypothetical protein n=1 Tax=Pandoraea sp. NPDC090278 TaxID=3364391 RepID=UPI00383B7368
MPRIDAVTAGGRNALAFWDTLAVNEHTVVGLANSDDGYNVIVSGTPQRPTLFTSYQDHPRILVTASDKNGVSWIVNGKPLQSTAAGHSRRLARYFDAYRPMLHLRYFLPRSQDLIALRQTREQGAMPDIWAAALQLPSPGAETSGRACPSRAMGDTKTPSTRCLLLIGVRVESLFRNRGPIDGTPKDSLDDLVPARTRRSYGTREITRQ